MASSQQRPFEQRLLRSDGDSMGSRGGWGGRGMGGKWDGIGLWVRSAVGRWVHEWAQEGTT